MATTPPAISLRAQPIRTVVDDVVPAGVPDALNAASPVMPRWPGLAPTHSPRRGRALIALSLLPLLSACSMAGDFGRKDEDRARLSFLQPSPKPATTGSIPASSFPLTDDERELRGLARNLLANPYEPPRPVWRGIVPQTSDPGRGGASEAERYIDDLVNGPYRSSAARYSRLVDDTRNDLVRLDPFFMLARRIADLDMKRERSLPHVSGLKPEEAANARARVRENMILIADVHAMMQARVTMYRVALERLVIALPSPMAIEAERQRLELERRLAGIEVFAKGPPPVSLGPPLGDGPRVVSK